MSTLHFAQSHWAAICAARVGVRAAVDVAIGDKRGVSDPLCHPPFFAPWSSWTGSLTPYTDVSFVRTNSACSLHLSSAARGHVRLTDASQSLTGFARNLRSYR